MNKAVYILLSTITLCIANAKVESPLKIGGASLSWVSVTKDSAKIYENSSRDSKVIGSAEWMSPYVVIEIKRDGSMQMLKVGNYISSDEADVVGWIRKRDLLTSTNALKSSSILLIRTNDGCGNQINLEFEMSGFSEAINALKY